MRNYLWNPFKYVAGAKALLIGLLILITTSIAGHFGNTFFPDLASVKVGHSFSMAASTLLNLVNWIVNVLVFYFLALIFSTSKIRLIDFLGTLAFARAPFLLVSFTGLSGSIWRVSEYLMNTAIGVAVTIELKWIDWLLFLILTVFMVLVAVWYFVLMYNALKISSNLKNPALVVIYIAGIIISWIISFFINHQFVFGINL